MADFDSGEFRFEIEAYTPDTIPMERLAQYMSVFAKLLAHRDNIHFKKLRKGSTTIVARAEHEAIPKVAERLGTIRVSEAPMEAMDTVRAANEMLREDNARGKIFHGKSAMILYFPGREIPRPQKVGPFSEPISIKGELVRLEGEDATKHAGIKDAQGRVWSGDMTMETALGLGPYMWQWVQVDGMARWLRNEDGNWELRAFHIHSFHQLAKDSLEEDVKKLREVKGNEWSDASSLRNDDDELH